MNPSYYDQETNGTPRTWSKQSACKCHIMSGPLPHLPVYYHAAKCLIHLFINYFMSSTAHMASKKKSKTNEGGNKGERQKIWKRRGEKKKQL